MSSPKVTATSSPKVTTTGSPKVAAIFLFVQNSRILLIEGRVFFILILDLMALLVKVQRRVVTEYCIRVFVGEVCLF